jgi:hypothetical protein
MASDKEEQVRVAYINSLPSGIERVNYALALVVQGLLSMEDSAKLLYKAGRARENKLPPSKDEDFEILAHPAPLEPPPKVEKVKPILCTCGAELMGQAKAWSMCGDCSMSLALPGRPRASLDQRIAEAQPPKVDKDPTEAWSAGQTPNWEWP